jgi:hypothetical protein
VEQQPREELADEWCVNVMLTPDVHPSSPIGLPPASTGLTVMNTVATVGSTNIISGLE